MSQTDSPLGTAPVGKLVLQLTIPAMLAQFVNILYGVVDRMYVRPYRGCGRCGAGRCRRVRACGDHDNRHPLRSSASAADR